MKARHTVLSILFMTWIVSTMDRMAMTVAIPYIAVDYHLGPVGSGVVMSVFFAGYSISQIPGGLLADIFGVRKVATLAMLWWSVFTAITGAAANLTQMVIVRFLFGLGEGVFPACSFKTIAVWFPKKERATASAIMLASNPLGAALAPLAVVGIMSIWGWRTVFYSLFIPGLLMSLLFWIFISGKPSESGRVSPEELGEIEGSDDVPAQNVETKTNLIKIVKEPNVLKYFFVLFTFDIAFWGFTAWLPTYLVKARGFSMAQMGVAASLPFFAGTVGSIFGGWVSDKYFSNNRRVPIVIAQLMSAFLLYLTFIAKSATILMICQALAGFCLVSFFSAFWALPMNTVPKQLMGVTSGFINMAGQIAAFVSPVFIGYLVGAAGGKYDHTFIFLVVSLLVSCGIVFTLPSKLQLHQEEAVYR
jgi:sugar phosphate permease